MVTQINTSIEQVMVEARPALAYRKDIDGLRAVAVVSVLFYHLKLKVWGGFIGVDVFFVISGFLISSGIFREIAESRFSLSSFYQRRIRRIFPALIVMMAVSTVAACIFLMPSELEGFAKSLLAATGSVSNFFFWLHSGYFDTAAADQPLLHTWSLGVEEQFYIFFPIFLVCIRRFFPRHLKVSILCLATASFALSAVGAYMFVTATFYLPLTRAWELLLGTILSLDFFPRVSSALVRNIMSAAGLLMIVVAAFAYDIYTPFPGIAALPPCLGAALIIAAGQSGDSWVARLLSLRPIVFLGLISYSLYLWHWPFIVFQRQSIIQIPGASERNIKLGVLCLSVIVATLSWKFIEGPFRKGKLTLKGKSAFAFAAASSVVLLLAGSAILVARGFPSRYTPEEVQVASYAGENVSGPYRIGTCYINSTRANFSPASCLRVDPSRENVLLFGDSHAAQLWYGLAKVSPNINFLEATSSGCEPTLSHRALDTERCDAIMDYVINKFLPTQHVDAVLLTARWEEGDLNALASTLAHLKEQKVNVILLGPIIQYDSALPRLLALSLIRNDSSLPARHELIKYRTLDAEMAALASTKWHVQYISYFKLLCNDTQCDRYASKDVPLQFDYGHLTSEGSLLVAQRMKASGAFPLASH